MTGVTVVDGKITDKTEVALPTVDSLQGDINMTEQKATEGAAIKAVKVENGELVVTSTEKLFTNSDVNGGTADAGTNYLLQSVKLENGTLSAVTTVEIVDQYPTAVPAQ